MRIYRVPPFALLSATAVAAASLAGTSPASAAAPGKAITLGVGQQVRTTDGKLTKGPAAQRTAKGDVRRPGAAPGSSSSEYKPREVIVKFASTATAAERSALRDSVGAVSSDKIGPASTSGPELLTLATGASAADAAAKLDRSPAVEYAERNAVVRLSAAPNDPYYADQYQLNNLGTSYAAGEVDADIDAPEAWNTNIGTSSTTIAIVDTGVDYTHSDLAPNIWSNPGETGTASNGSNKATNGVDDDGNGYVDDVRGVNTAVAPTAPGANDPAPIAWHGTHVASLAAARGNNGDGISGVSQQAKILPLQVFHVDGDDVVADYDDILEGVQYAIAKGAQVINGSFGGPDESTALTSLIAANPNVTFVFAAGNDGANVDTTPTWPCVTPGGNVICVGATDSNDSRASFSNYGSTGVDLSAAGVNVAGLMPTGSTFGGLGIAWMGASGTSMATPIVAGAAAVLKSASPTLTAAQIRTRLISTADPVVADPGSSSGNGRLNLANALSNTVPSVGGNSTVSVASGKLTYTAASGASNIVDASVSGSTIRIKESRVNLTPGAGCTTVTAKEVSCASAGITSTEFNLGDKNDWFTSSLSLSSTVNAGAGADFISGGSGNDVINGGDGFDKLYAKAGSDTINAGNGDDWVAGGDGADTIYAGAGNDWQDYSDEAGDDIVNGEDGNDTLQGAGGNDKLVGGEGNDFLNTGSGTGIEIADGGNGDDALANTDSLTQKFIGGAGTDTVDYSYPADAPNINLPRTVTIGATSGNGFLPGESDSVATDVDVVIGSDGHDTLTGGPNPSTLRGMAGHDYLKAGTGPARLEGDGDRYSDVDDPDGHDTFEGGPGNDTIIGEGGDDEMYYTSANAGSDSIDLGAGDDWYVDSPGNATIDLGDGNDTAYFLTDSGADDLHGGAGTDSIDFSMGGTNINLSLDDAANDGDFTYMSSVKNIHSDFEVLRTGSGADALTGTNNSTTYYPGAGKDIVTAGSSADTIVANDGAVDRINAGGGTDIVTADQIDLVKNGELPTLEVSAGAVSASAVNLTTDTTLGATTDWIHWSGTSGSIRERKNAPLVINGWTKNGSASVTLPTGSSTFSWSDAASAPTSASSAVGSATGSSVGHGFRYTVPVTANQPVTVRAFTGLINGGAGQLKVWYSSNPSAVTSGPVVTNGGTQLDRTFTISGRPNANDTLNVEWALTGTNGSTTRSILYAAQLFR